MSGTKTKNKVTPQERFWINNALGKLGRKPKVGGGGGRQDVAFQRNPLYESGQIAQDRQPDEGSSSGGERENPQALLEQLLGTDEKVSRDRKLFGKKIGESKDKGFNRNVRTPVEGLAAEMGDVLSGERKPTVPELVRALEVRETLVTEQGGYGERKGGEKSRAKREQRDRKVDAIGSRVEALDKLVGVNPAAMGELLIPGQNDEGRAPLSQDDVKLVVAALMKGPGAEDEFASSLLEELFARQIETETRGHAIDEAKKNLVRSNTAASVLLSAYMKDSESGKAFRQQYADDIRTTLPTQTIEPDEYLAGSKVAADQGAELLVGYVNTVLDQTIGRGIPVPVKAAAVKVAQEVRDKGLDDDREVAIAVSAVVVLRVVNPVLNDLRNRPDITQAQNRTLALVQKAMQNLANGVDGSKEPFMVPVTKALKDREADMMRWMLQIAEGGD